MSILTSTNSALLAPEDVQKLLVKPVEKDSVAMQVSTIDIVSGHDVRYPIITRDPAVNWTREGEEITPADLSTDEVKISLSKAAGLTIVSRELIEDANENAIAQIGRALVRQISQTIDKAYFSKQAAPAPQGVGSAAGLNEITTSGSLTNLDPFEEALVHAETTGENVGAFIANSKTVLAISQLKESTTSQRGLLQADATAQTTRSVHGVPLLACDHVADKTIFAIPRNASHVANLTGTNSSQRGAEIIADNSAYFSSDRVAVRGIMRIGFAITHPESISKITIK